MLQSGRSYVIYKGIFGNGISVLCYVADMFERRLDNREEIVKRELFAYHFRGTSIVRTKDRISLYSHSTSRGISRMSFPIARSLRADISILLDLT